MSDFFIQKYKLSNLRDTKQNLIILLDKFLNKWPFKILSLKVLECVMSKVTVINSSRDKSMYWL